MEPIDDLTLLKQFFRCSHGIRAAQRYQGQSRLLILLAERGTLTQRELADLTGRRSATLSEQLANMESAGYVTRRTNASDRRNMDIALTAAGRTAAADAREDRSRLAKRAFGDLDAEEKQLLFRLLAGVAEKFVRETARGEAAQE